MTNHRVGIFGFETTYVTTKKEPKSFVKKIKNSATIWIIFVQKIKERLIYKRLVVPRGLQSQLIARLLLFRRHVL